MKKEITICFSQARGIGFVVAGPSISTTSEIAFLPIKKQEVDKALLSTLLFYSTITL